MHSWPESPTHKPDPLWLFLGKEQHCAEQGHCTLCHTSLLPGQGEKTQRVKCREISWCGKPGQARLDNHISISADAPQVVPNNISNCLVLIITCRTLALPLPSFSATFSDVLHAPPHRPPVHDCMGHPTAIPPSPPVCRTKQCLDTGWQKLKMDFWC